MHVTSLKWCTSERFVQCSSQTSLKGHSLDARDAHVYACGDMRSLAASLRMKKLFSSGKIIIQALEGKEPRLLAGLQVAQGPHLLREAQRSLQLLTASWLRLGKRVVAGLRFPRSPRQQMHGAGLRNESPVVLM